MKVNMFNHWFKYKVPVSKHADHITNSLIRAGDQSYPFWEWLDYKYDVGQYYKVNESRNYLVFHNRNHYLMFLLKL
jgi:hypothetical protein